MYLILGHQTHETKTDKTKRRSRQTHKHSQRFLTSLSLINIPTRQKSQWGYSSQKYYQPDIIDIYRIL